MAKRGRKEDFELDDWSFDDSQFGLDDFEADVAPTSNDRNPMLKAAGAVFSGAKDTALDPNTMKQFLKKSLPKEYGSTVSLAEQTVSLGRTLYDDLDKELRPVVQEARKVGKRILPSVKGLLPESVYSRLSDFMEDDDRRDSTPSQEELINQTINSSLAEIFEAKDQQEAKIREDEAVQKRIDDTVQAKRHVENQTLFGQMNKSLARLAQYQDKVTVNWQRKTLELQYRQYFLQKESLEEQKKSTAILQTNLEGILKNTGLPDFVKISKIEAGKQNLRDRFLNSTFDGLIGQRRNYVQNFFGNVRKIAKQRIMDLKDNLKDAFEMADQLADSQEMMQDMGVDGKDLAAEMVGGNLAQRAMFRGARWIRGRMPSKVRKAGQRMSNVVADLPAWMQRAAEEGQFENTPIIGGLFNLLYEAHEDTKRRDSTIQSSTTQNLKDPAFFDYRTHNTINDVIPGYLARILQTNQTQLNILRHVHPSARKIKDARLLEYDADRRDFRLGDSVDRKVLTNIFKSKEQEEVTKNINEIVDRIQNRANDVAEDREMEKITLTEEQKFLLGRRLLEMNVEGGVINPYEIQQAEFWGKDISEENREVLMNFMKLYLGEAKDPDEFINTEKGWRRIKKNLQHHLYGDKGYDDRELGRFQDMVKDMGRELNGYLPRIQEQVDLGHENRLKRLGIIDRSGNFDEKQATLNAYRGYSPSGIDENESTGNRNIHQHAGAILTTINQMKTDEQHWRNPKFRKLMPRLKRLSPTLYYDYLSKTGLEDRVDEEGKVRQKKGGGWAKGGYTGYQFSGQASGRYQTPEGFMGAGYTGDGSKYQEAGKVHYNEVVWSQEDVARFGGLANVETIRKYGLSALSKIRDSLNQAKTTAKEFLDRNLSQESLANLNVFKEDSFQAIGKNVAEIRDLLKAGIPVSHFTQGAGVGISPQEVPWYLRSFGSVIGDLAALPFKATKAFARNTWKGANWIKKKTSSLFSSKWMKGIWTGAQDIWGRAVNRTLKLKDKYADKFDVWIKGEVAPRLTRFKLLNGQYYNSKGEPIKSWKDIDSGGVWEVDEKGEWVNVLPAFDIKKAFVVNYEAGKSMVLDGISKAKDFVLNRAKDFRDGLGNVAGLAMDTATAAFKMAKNHLFRPEDVYVKDKIYEGPRLLAIIMKRGGYYNKSTGKQIWNPADIEGEVIDEYGDVVLSIADLKEGLVDKQNKPLRIGLGKVTGWLSDKIGTAFKGVWNAGVRIKNGIKSMFGGVKNFFAQFFGDGGIIFANSNKLVDKLDIIYKLLDERIPRLNKISGDKDGDGDRDGSIKDLRARNKLAQLRKAEEMIRERREAEALRNKGFGTARAAAFDPFAKIGGLVDSVKERLGFGNRDGVDINIDSDGRSRRDRLRDRARRGARRGRTHARRGMRGLRGRLPSIRGRMPSIGLGGSRLGGLARGATGIGAGLLMSGAANMANAAGYEGLGTALDVGGSALGIYSTASMATSALGLGSLPTLGGLASGGLALAGKAGGLALSAGGSIMGSLASAGAFLATNPIGWGILAAAAIGAAGYGIYRWMKRNKFGQLGEYRYVQYGFPDGDKDWVARVADLETFFEKDKLNVGEQVTLKDDKIDLKEFLKIFDVTPDQREQVMKVLQWYNHRFKPIYQAHLSALNKIKSGTKIHDVDDKLTKEEKLRYLQMVELPQGPYDMKVSPFNDLESLPSGRDEVKNKYEKVKKAIEEGRDSVFKRVMNFGMDVASKAIPGVALAKGAYDYFSGKRDTEGEEASAKQAAGRMAQQLASGTAATLTTTSIVSNTSDNLSNSKGELTALETIRLKAYGLRIMEQDKVTQLKRLEQRLLDYIHILPDKQAEFKGDIDNLKMETATLFGIGKNNIEELAFYQHYLTNRFLPVLLAYVSAMAKLSNKSDAKAAFAFNVKPNDALAVATELVSLNTAYGSIWTIEKGLWPGVTLNNDVSTTEPHINAIKAKVTTRELYADQKTTQTQVGGDNGTLDAVTQQQRKQAQVDAYEKAVSQASSAIPTGGTPGFSQRAQETTSMTASQFGGQLAQATAGGSLNVQEGTGGLYSQVPQPTGKGWANVKNTILAAAKIVGMDAGLMGAMAAQESGLDPNIRAKTSTATGLFQFIQSTWNGMKAKYANRYGIPANAPATDGAANAILGAAYMRENYNQLKSLGMGSPNPGDIYLAHFLGLGGARRALKANQNESAAAVFPREANANRAIFYDNGRPRTVAEMRAFLTQKMVNSGKQHNVDIPINMSQGLTPPQASSTGSTPTASNDLAARMQGHTMALRAYSAAHSAGSNANQSTTTGTGEDLAARMRGHATAAVAAASTGSNNPWAQHAGSDAFRNQGGYGSGDVRNQPSMNRAAVDSNVSMNQTATAEGRTLQDLLKLAEPLQLAGKAFVKPISNSVNLSGMKAEFMKLFYAAVAEWSQRGGGIIQVTDAFRTRAQQEALYRRYGAGRAARPGHSRHESGVAIDLNNNRVMDLKSGPIDKFFNSGVAGKWGFIRPIARRKNGTVWEPWHVENKFFSRGKDTGTHLTQDASRPQTQQEQAQQQPVISAVATPNQMTTAVPTADTQRDHWEAVRKNNNLGFGEGTVLDNLRQMTGQTPDLAAATRSAQAEANQINEQAKAASTQDILNKQLEEQRKTNTLLNSIYDTLKGMAKTPTTQMTKTEPSPTQSKDIRRMQRQMEQNHDTMPKGSLNVTKRSYSN